MATEKNRHTLNSNAFFALISALLATVFFSCSSAPKKNNQTPVYGPDQPSVVVSEIPKPQESFGPTEPPPAETVFGPTVLQKKKIQLVFTQGLARSFAAAGALVALDQAGVEIESVSGVEISGLIAGLYGFSQNQNEFEWWIQKLNMSDFVSKNLLSGFFKRGRISSQKMEEKLKQYLKQKKDFASARVFINLCSNKEGGPFEQIRRVAKTGALYENPEGCDDETWTPKEGDLGLARTVIVDLLGEPRAGYSKKDSDLEEKYKQIHSDWVAKFNKAALVLRPKVSEYDLLDFDRKTDLFFKGKEAVEVEIEKIRELLK